jgi:periplasmic protein TonB
MKRREQLKHASSDGLASNNIEPAVSESGTVCLAADIERPQRSWVPPTPASDRGLWMGATLVSALLHTSALLFFVEKLTPRASIGVEVIAVDVVLGADAEAGLAPTPSRSEVSSTPKEPKEEYPENRALEPAGDDAQFREASPVVPDVKDDVSEPRPVMIAHEAPTVTPDVAVARDLAEPPPERAVHGPGREAPARSRPEAKAPAKQSSKNARDSGPPSSAATTASNSVGRGRSDNDTNYRGIVAAHLARYKQFPADARGRGDEGDPAVTFTVDGGGRVTSVRLAHSAGIASLDQEVQAMVRRASLFPAPPAGHAITFTVPVSFQLR